MSKHWGWRLPLVLVLLLAVLLSGCAGGSKTPKVYEIVVQVTPPLAGVEIRDQATGKVLQTTNAESIAELKVASGTVIEPFHEGYEFSPAEQKITGQGSYPFTAQPKAVDPEELVAELEATPLPEHYEQYLLVAERLNAAYDAVEGLSDYGRKAELGARVESFRKSLYQHLEAFVSGVNGAASEEELLAALAAFWNVDPELSPSYWTIFVMLEPKPTDVDEVFRELVEAARTAAAEELAVQRLFAAALDSSEAFREVLAEYTGIWFTRVNMADPEVVEAYRVRLTELVVPAAVESGAALVQQVIDEVNLEFFQAAWDPAQAGLERSAWLKVCEFWEYLPPAEKEVWELRIAELGLLITIGEAAQAQDYKVLLEVLASLELDYLNYELAERYAAALLAAAPGERNQPSKIQLIINTANEQYVKDILLDLAGVDSRTPPGIAEAYLIQLDQATPILDLAVGREVDFDLGSAELLYTRDNLENYRDELARFSYDPQEPVTPAIRAVEKAIMDGNGFADEPGYVLAVEEISARLLPGEPLTVTLTVYAQDLVGGPHRGLHGQQVEAQLRVTDVGLPPAAQGQFVGSRLDLRFTDVPVDQVGEYETELILHIGDAQSTTLLVVLTVTALPSAEFSTVQADREQYRSSQNIRLTITLNYGADARLTTENGEYGALIVIGEDIYHRLVTFREGVARVSVPARTATSPGIPDFFPDEAAPIQVTIHGILPWWQDLALENAAGVVIVPGDPRTLRAELELDDGLEWVLLIVEDENGNQVWAYGGPKQVRLTAEPVELSLQSVPRPEMPDQDGYAVTDFTYGVGTLWLSDSPFVTSLPPGSYELTLRVQDQWRLRAVIPYEKTK